MTKQIAKVDPLMKKAQHLCLSGLFGDITPQDAYSKALLGQAYGLNPAASQLAFYVVPGKPPSLSANLIAKLVQQSNKYQYRVREYSHEKCTLEFFDITGKEKESLGKITWTLEDAKRVGVYNKKGEMWQKYPRNMLFSRAVTEGARLFCPDVFGGIAPYCDEELGNPVRDEDIQEAEFEVKESESA